MQSRSTQRGGTIFGLLIGLAIGVGIAVAIAFWLGKQSPVVNKMQPKGSLSEAEETNKNKTWDPNAGLFGKAVPPSLQTMAANAASAASAALSASTSTEATQRAAPDAKASLPASPAPAAPVSAAASTKPKSVASAPLSSGDSVADLLKAKAKAAAAPAPAPLALPQVNAAGDGGVYFVQVGAFKAPEDANAQKAKLALLGVETKVTEREQSGKTVYRVRAGVFKKIEEAEAMKAKLDKAGFDTVLVKTPI